MGLAMAKLGPARQRNGEAKKCKEQQGRSTATSGVAQQRQSGAVLSNSMAEKSADVICEGKVVHRNDSLRQGFASDALAWKREEMP